MFTIFAQGQNCVITKGDFYFSYNGQVDPLITPVQFNLSNDNIELNGILASSYTLEFTASNAIPAGNWTGDVFYNGVQTIFGQASATRNGVIYNSLTGDYGVEVRPNEINTWIDDPNNPGHHIDVNLEYVCVNSNVIVNILPTQFVCELGLTGTSIDTVQNIVGLDSVLNVQVTQLSPSLYTFLPVQTSCFVDSTGIFIDTLQTSINCDSIVVQPVRLLPSLVTVTQTQGCENSIVTTPYTAANGCDSLVHIVTFMEPIVYVDVSPIYVCNFDETGIFRDTSYNQITGCIDTITTQVVQLFPTSITILNTLGTCDPYQQDSIRILNGINCDSMVIQPYTYLGSSETTVTLFTCEQGDVGISVTNFTNQFGCDSTVTVFTQLYPITNNITLSDSIVCDVDLVRNDTIVQTNQFGCEYFIIQPYVYEGENITFLPPTTTCNLSQVGTFQDTLSNHNGCDSIVIMTVQLDPQNINYLSDSLICDPALAGLDTIMYSNTITGCDSITVQALVYNFINISPFISNVSCYGAQDGAISLFIDSNTPINNIFWFDGSNEDDIDSLDAGSNYWVVVTSTAGCEVEETFTISQPIQMFLETSTTNPSCSAGTNGLINVVPKGGTAPYTYIWNDGDTTHLRQELPAGEYTVTVTDAHGCNIVRFYTLEETAPLEISLQETIVTCTDGNNGEVSVSVEGGAAPYTYIWNNDATTERISGLTPGIYSVTVTDANGCTATTSIELECDGCRMWVDNNTPQNERLFVKVHTGNTESFTLNVEILDIFGKATGTTFTVDVIDGKGEGEFPLDALQAGVYLAVAEGGNIYKVIEFSKL